MLRDFKSSAFILCVIIYNQASGFQNSFMTQSEMYCQSLLTGNCLHILVSGCSMLSLQNLKSKIYAFVLWMYRSDNYYIPTSELIFYLFFLPFFSPCGSWSTFMAIYIFTSSDLLIYSFTFVLCTAKTHSNSNHQFLMKLIICLNSDPH